MARDVETPPDNPEALAAMLGTPNDKPDPTPKATTKKAVAKKTAGDSKPVAKLPSARMGDPCKTPDCKGKLTDLSRAHIGKSAKSNGFTRITLICNKCNKVQGQVEIQDLN